MRTIILENVAQILRVSLKCFTSGGIPSAQEESKFATFLRDFVSHLSHPKSQTFSLFSALLGHDWRHSYCCHH